jgi:hypothetical protein
VYTTPTDRGYVKIDSRPDGSNRVEVFARSDGVGKPTHPIAVHAGCPRVLYGAGAEFTAVGGSIYSTTPVEVVWDETRNAVLLREPIPNGLQP